MARQGKEVRSKLARFVEAVVCVVALPFMAAGLVVACVVIYAFMLALVVICGRERELFEDPIIYPKRNDGSDT